MTAAAFSTPENAALERETESTDDVVDINHIWTEKHQKVCFGWIKQNKYQNVCIQFPDNYLTHSTKIVDNLKENTDAKFFILADTSYGSCCVDEIAASHVKADSLIHFGNACKSKVSRLPVLYMLPVLPFHLDQFLELLKPLVKENDNKKFSVNLDIGYHYLLDEDDDYFYGKINECANNDTINVEKYPFDEEHKDCQSNDNEETVSIFIGADNERFFNLAATTKTTKWYIYDPSTNQLSEKNPLVANWIRRRYFYIEKCKDAQTLGLIVATLTSDGYLDVVDHIKAMARSRGIKTQIISVGRINPAKLANFLEIDCFVLIGCPFNNLYNSRDFFKPIVSVFEAEMAYNPAWHMKYPEAYVTDFKEILPYGKYFFEFNASDMREGDVSLVSGRMRNVEDSSTNGAVELGSGTVAEMHSKSVQEKSVGLSFEDRSWKGLEPALGCTEPAKLVKGRSGIPINYTHE